MDLTYVNVKQNTIPKGVAINCSIPEKCYSRCAGKICIILKSKPDVSNFNSDFIRLCFRND